MIHLKRKLGTLLVLAWQPLSIIAAPAPLFDGKTLNGWDGDPTYWRVENGNIVGEVTPANLLKRNSFLIWRGGTVGNFELVVEYRVSAKGHSGINYRSIAPWFPPPLQRQSSRYSRSLSLIVMVPIIARRHSGNPLEGF